MSSPVSESLTCIWRSIASCPHLLRLESIVATMIDSLVGKGYISLLTGEPRKASNMSLLTASTSDLELEHNLRGILVRKYTDRRKAKRVVTSDFRRLTGRGNLRKQQKQLTWRISLMIYLYFKNETC